MGRRQTDSELSRLAVLIIFVLGCISFFMFYFCFSVGYKPSTSHVSLDSTLSFSGGDQEEEEEERCCRGIEHLELWGDAVKWGANFKVNSSKECCMACKDTCEAEDRPCSCDSWVFCGDKQACGSRFGECWLKKQKDALEPNPRDARDQVMWTSGLIFGKGEGIVRLETEYGTLHVKLLPDSAPLSVAYMLELLASRHCVGCQFHRAESRGTHWDTEGNHIENAPGGYGPPFALIQGSLETHSITFKEIPLEVCSTIRRGSVAWVGSGPEFFISLANHNEWKKVYTVFGIVLPEDMAIAERIARLPTKQEVWSNVNVSVLEKPIPLRFRRISTSQATL
ncbi:hypothetical protein CICLE_v10023925mg [Citrus x clementina]|uniref:PPIase cyclophilin-type domain-containing protein n=1 Tax=Citrus clementina TaxID=85681 RepID=V4TEC9_CITCL|nr:uncharacterized protein LOC18047745 isoform X1 [Citrus x clementina]ESR58693.1 hypothetical protein CICLE_v10023925mg [Citrus x clementina]